MEINKSSWHYRAWEWSHREWGFGDVPKQSNLCTYMRRLTVVFPLTVFFYAFMILMVGLIIVVPFNIILIPFGRYLRHPILEELNGWHRPIFVSYQGLKIGNFRLLPWHIFAPVLTVLLVWWNYRVINRHDFGNVLLIIEFAIILTAILLGVPFLYSQSQTGKLAREYIDAKTKGICPLIAFKDDQ